MTTTNEQMLRPMGGAKYKLLRRYGVVPNVVKKRPPLERRASKRIERKMSPVSIIPTMS